MMRGSILYVNFCIWFRNSSGYEQLLSVPFIPEEETRPRPGTALPFFALRGRPGDAVVFWHWTGSRLSDWKDRFHGGCPALGATKLAMQSYREASDWAWVKLVNRREEEVTVERVKTAKYKNKKKNAAGADSDEELITTLPPASTLPESRLTEVLLRPGMEILRLTGVDTGYRVTAGEGMEASRAEVVEVLGEGSRPSARVDGMQYRLFPADDDGPDSAGEAEKKILLLEEKIRLLKKKQWGEEL